jgi:endonuclease/exonuclease/phosphatase (EEP) superfamily protein YafD
VNPLQENIQPSDQSPAPIKPTRPRHRQWSGVLCGLVFGIVGLVAGRLGHLYSSFDVFSQFGLQFVAICVGFIIAVFFPRFKMLVGTAITIALLSLYSAWPHIVSSQLQNGPYSLVAGEQVLRVAHFNTFKNNRDYASIANEVLRLNADVVSLVEMNDEKKQSVLPKLLAVYPYQFDCKQKTFCDQSIVSKLPFSATESQQSWDGPPFVMVRLGGAFAGVSVFSVHTTRFPHLHKWRRFALSQNGLKTYPVKKL